MHMFQTARRQNSIEPHPIFSSPRNQPRRKMDISPLMKIYLLAIFTLLFVALGYLAGSNWFVALIAYSGCLPFWFYWMCGDACYRSSSGPRFPFSEGRPIRPNIRSTQQAPPREEIERCAKELEAVLDASLNTSNENPEDQNLPSSEEDDFSSCSVLPEGRETSAQEAVRTGSSSPTVENVVSELFDPEYHSSATLKLPSRSKSVDFVRYSALHSDGIVKDAPELESVQDRKRSSTVENLKSEFIDPASENSATLKLPSLSTKRMEESGEMERCVQDLEAVMLKDLGLPSSRKVEITSYSAPPSDEMVKKSPKQETIQDESLSCTVDNRGSAFIDSAFHNSETLKLPSRSAKPSEEYAGIERCTQDLEPGRFKNESVDCSNENFNAMLNDLDLSSETIELSNPSTKYTDNTGAIVNTSQDFEPVTKLSLNTSSENPQDPPLNDFVFSSSETIKVPDCSESVESQNETGPVIDYFDEDTSSNCKSSLTEQPIIDEDGPIETKDNTKESDNSNHEYSLGRVPLELLYVVPAW